MKKTLTECEIVDELLADKFAGWSFEGAQALARFLIECEEDTGEEMEFDPIALRCCYSEHATHRDFAVEFFGDRSWREDLCLGADTDEDAIREAVEDYVRDRTAYIPFGETGLIVGEL